MKKQIFVLLMVLPFFSISLIAAAPDEIPEKNRLSRDETVKNDKESRAVILKKFSDFQTKVKNFAPDMKINIPVNPDKAEDILELENESEIKKQEKYFAQAGENYKLKALPYDSIEEYTASVSKGDRITVLMKPDLKKDKSHLNITKEWLLIRTADGIEGYIPLNLLLNKFQISPADDYFISNKFGKRTLEGEISRHIGADFTAPCGTNVVSAADGIVIMAVEDSNNCSSCGFGSYVIIEHKNGYRTFYAHLTSVSVKKGQRLNSGEEVGTMGNTGHSDGCHLHFEIRTYEEFVNPLNYMHP